MKDRRLTSNQLSSRAPEVTESRAYEEHCLHELRNAGFRITMPRIQVIRALADTEVALSAYAIHEKILGSGGRIDVVSVYRILNTLVQVGLIHKIGLADGYFPCRMGDCQGRRTMVFVTDESLEIRELTVPVSAMNEIEAAVSSAGYIPAAIKIEINGSPKVSR